MGVEKGQHARELVRDCRVGAVGPSPDAPVNILGFTNIVYGEGDGGLFAVWPAGFGFHFGEWQGGEQAVSYDGPRIELTGTRSTVFGLPKPWKFESVASILAVGG